MEWHDWTDEGMKVVSEDEMYWIQTGYLLKGFMVGIGLASVVFYLIAIY